MTPLRCRTAPTGRASVPSFLVYQSHSHHRCHGAQDGRRPSRPTSPPPTMAGVASRASRTAQVCSDQGTTGGYLPRAPAGALYMLLISMGRSFGKTFEVSFLQV